ncbi:MAG: HD domain-containing phosphohydrolase [Pseudothermotoga sp.]|uniref:HD domain-containing phosphohydrolase n=1 Tax=Pseudothermotoga sp. TaxID=2033661 RepID=UPI00258D1F73|nr:HD domain-containing phosphohydrolase [Pseudothermotoga sp.]MDI6862202.1 HD domain-containing phosphohydrolase [Pseudothermotoga sp.]
MRKQVRFSKLTKNLLIITYYAFTFSLFFTKVNVILMATLLSFPVLHFAVNQGLREGLTAAITSSALVVIANRIFKRADLWQVSLAILAYFLFAVLVGRAKELFNRQNRALKEMEEKYKDLYEKFKAYLDLAPVVILGFDLNGKVVLANRKACELLGCDMDEIVGKNWIENFLPDRIKDEVRDVFEKIKNGELKPVEVYENPIVNKKNEERLILWHNGYLKDENGHIQAIISAGLDVTEKRQLENELQEQLSVFKTLTDILEHLIKSDLNVKERATMIARACVELFGAHSAWVGYAAPDESVRVMGKYPEDDPSLKNIIARWDDSPYGRGAAGRSIKSGNLVLIEDTLTDSTYEVWRGKAKLFGIRTVAAFPLVNAKRVYGTLVVRSDKSGFFNEKRIQALQLLASAAASALENAQLFEDLQRSFEKLSTLQMIDKVILFSNDLTQVLREILDQVVRALNVDSAFLALYNTKDRKFEQVAKKGFKTNVLEETLNDLVAGFLDADGEKNLKERDLPNEPSRKKILQEEKFQWYHSTVLLLENRPLCCLFEVYRSDVFEPDREWLDFFTAIVNQIKIAIERILLLRDLQEANTKLLKAYDETIEALARAIDMRDAETYGHSERVANLTVQIAKAMGIEKEQLIHIRRGALLHDIGKLAIPDRILLKPGKLDEEEWKIMKMHPLYAQEMLSKIEYLKSALDIPLYHHERWDGNGYPFGLKGEEIPLSARIFAVVDVYDALTSDRPYRKAWTKQEAIEYIKNQSGRQFDPKVVEVFLKILEQGA